MPATDLPLLVAAAREAGAIALRHFRSDHATWEKDEGQGPVTQADLDVDAMLKARLTAARPDYGWMSEESPENAARLDRERVFVVDPIDGTRAFVEGHTAWSHSLAVVAHGRPVAGVVFLPALGKLYAAAYGCGAELNGRAVAASPRQALAGADLLAARPTFHARHWRGGAPEVKRHFRSSLAYRLALVGEGRFDGMLTLRDSWEWDIAAGALIAVESGARVTDRFGKPPRFNTPERKTAGVICATPGVHAAILDRLIV